MKLTPDEMERYQIQSWEEYSKQRRLPWEKLLADYREKLAEAQRKLDDRGIRDYTAMIEFTLRDYNSEMKTVREDYDKYLADVYPQIQLDRDITAYNLSRQRNQALQDTAAMAFVLLGAVYLITKAPEIAQGVGGIASKVGELIPG